MSKQGTHRKAKQTSHSPPQCPRPHPTPDPRPTARHGRARAAGTRDSRNSTGSDRKTTPPPPGTAGAAGGRRQSEAQTDRTPSGPEPDPRSEPHPRPSARRSRGSETKRGTAGPSPSGAGVGAGAGPAQRSINPQPPPGAAGGPPRPFLRRSRVRPGGRRTGGWTGRARRVPQRRVFAVATALSTAAALLRHSVSSACGSESATTPAPAWTYAVPPRITAVRMAIAVSESPAKSR